MIISLMVKEIMIKHYFYTIVNELCKCSLRLGQQLSERERRMRRNAVDAYREKF